MTRRSLLTVVGLAAACGDVAVAPPFGLDANPGDTTAEIEAPAGDATDTDASCVPEQCPEGAIAVAFVGLGGSLEAGTLRVTLGSAPIAAELASDDARVRLGALPAPLPVPSLPAPAGRR